MFEKPIVVQLSTVVEEQIYDFRRRTILSPKITDNNNLKCCVVTGQCGAKSSAHAHPGDEVVFTLNGESVNSFQTKQIRTSKYQSLAVPPNTLHSTEVKSLEGWGAVSFYCDDCPLISIVDDLDGQRFAIPPSCGSQDGFIGGAIWGEPQKKILFSPESGQTGFIELFLLDFSDCSGGKIHCSQTMSIGETIYFVISGTFTLSFGEESLLFTPGVTVALPPLFRHNLKKESSCDGLVLVASCSKCPLLLYP